MIPFPPLNLLPLDTWRAYYGLNPWHFWGLADTSIVPINSKCSGLVYEYDWQGSDAAGRDSIRQAIAEAEQKLTTYLQVAPAPRYTEATVLWPRYHDSGRWRITDVGGDGRRIAVALPEGEVRALGVPSYTLIGTARSNDGSGTLFYNEQLNTGFPDSFTATLPIPDGMTLTADQVGAYVPADDRIDDTALSERWRILPVQVRISGGYVIVSGRRWLCVKPVQYENARTNAGPLDPTDAANFLTGMEIYQRTTDGNGQTPDDAQATLLWETQPCDGWWCCAWGLPSTLPSDSSRDPGATGYAIARAGIRDGPRGYVTPAQALYDTTTGLWRETWWAGGHEPDRVTVRYLAGVALGSDGQMHPTYRAIVAHLAAAELKRRICACRETNEKLHDDQQDLTLESTQTERYAVAPEDLSNPFGTRRGHVRAWRVAKDLIMRRGILA